ncbi:L-serine ammonia-lyase [Bacteroidota bacterium]
MESIRHLYKIGVGPSSSHTMGPKIASEQFLKQNPNAEKYKVTLYGSLASTGKGHLTDVAILNTFADKPCELIWKPETVLARHPNGMKFEAFDQDERLISEWTAYSTGGGNIMDESSPPEHEKIYPLSKLTDIIHYCEQKGMQVWEYVQEYEKSDVWTYLEEVWNVMQKAVKRGIQAEGVLPGGLNLPRKASAYYVKAKGYRSSLKRRGLAFSYALAVAEENASGGRIVTAPTCGSCGVLPGLLYLLHESYDFKDQKIIHALATAGLIGTLVKTNASISGAEVGCQGEIGTACAMSAAAAAQLFGCTPAQVEYAAEMGMEHHLGLTCDPVQGFVQVPCIERNAFAVARALDASHFSILSDGRHMISFDEVIFTMNQTGHDLPSLYRETSAGGLAMNWDMEEKADEKIE